MRVDVRVRGMTQRAVCTEETKPMFRMVERAYIEFSRITTATGTTSGYTHAGPSWRPPVTLSEHYEPVPECEGEV
jgi:hypothetical protein